MSNDTHSLDELHNQAVALLRQYRRTDPDLKTPLLRDLSEVLVEARSHFLRADGSPDWKGRSYPYRQWVSEVYFAAGYDRNESAKVQAAVRYHVGALLRERLDDETLEAYGLVKKTPKERSTEGRKMREALAAALTQSEIRGGSALSLAAALNVLSKVNREELAHADEDEKRVILTVLSNLETLTHDLRDTVKHAS